MATWNIRDSRGGVKLDYKTMSGVEVQVREPDFRGHSLQDVLAWVAGEMDVEDLATINGEPVMQRFSAVISNDPATQRRWLGEVS